MSQPSRDPSLTAAVGAAVLILLCCAGPVLLASGALAGLGAALRSPWLIGIGASIGVAALGYVAIRIARRHPPDQDDACCPPTDQSADQHDTQPIERPHRRYEALTRQHAAGDAAKRARP